MLKITCDISPTIENLKFPEIYEEISIGVNEKSGFVTILDTQEAQKQLVQNSQIFAEKLALFPYSTIVEITGGNAIWFYLTLASQLIENGVPFSYNDGKGIFNLSFKEYTIITELNSTEVQILDFSVKPEQVVEGIIQGGYLSGLKATVSGAFVSLTQEQSMIVEQILSNITINSKKVLLTGRGPVWLFLGVMNSLLGQVDSLQYKDVSATYLIK
jgi:hypothetical protein